MVAAAGAALGAGGSSFGAGFSGDGLTPPVGASGLGTGAWADPAGSAPPFSGAAAGAAAGASGYGFSLAAAGGGLTAGFFFGCASAPVATPRLKRTDRAAA